MFRGSMTKTLHIHIGHFKTGTTALQVFFKRNAENFAREGLLYPDYLERNCKHSMLAFTLYHAVGVKTLMHGYNRPESPSEMWQGLFDTVLNAPQPAALISSEEFMRLGAHPEAEELLRQLVRSVRGIDFRIIAYLRAPRAHTRSWYNQLVKMRIPVGDFNTTLCHGMENVHLDYAAAIRPWVNVFGAHRVYVRPFEDRLREGTAIFDDFLRTIGHRMPAGADIPQSDPNPRLDDDLLEIIRHFNNADYPKGMIRQGIERAQQYFASDEGRRTAQSADFEALSRTSRAGLEGLRGLPRNGVDIQRFLAELPEPEDEFSQAQTRQIGFLLNELMLLHSNMRKTLPELEARIEALEKAQQDFKSAAE